MTLDPLALPLNIDRCTAMQRRQVEDYHDRRAHDIVYMGGTEWQRRNRQVLDTAALRLWLARK